MKDEQGPTMQNYAKLGGCFQISQKFYGGKGGLGGSGLLRSNR